MGVPKSPQVLMACRPEAFPGSPGQDGHHRQEGLGYPPLPSSGRQWVRARGLEAARQGQLWEEARSPRTGGKAGLSGGSSRRQGQHAQLRLRWVGHVESGDGAQSTWNQEGTSRCR